MCRDIRLNVSKKKEQPEEIAKKILLFLNGLKKLDETEFSVWYQQGWSKKEALSKKVLFEEEYILNTVNKNWDKKFPELGTHFSFWTGKDDDLKNSLVSFMLGATSKNPNINSNLLLKIPIQVDSPTFVDGRIQEIVVLMQEIWGKYSYDIF